MPGNLDRMYRTIFDSDSQTLRIDNCATRSILSHTEDFITPLTPVKDKIQGISGKIDQSLMHGTIRWYIEDDDGVTHAITLPNSIYYPKAKSRLLSPQHWAQEAKDNQPQRNGTWCATYCDKIVLFWNQQKCQRTIPLDVHGENVATIRTAPGYKRFMAFCAEVESNDGPTKGLCYEAGIVSNDKHETDTMENHMESNTDDDNDNESAASQQDTPLQTLFNLDLGNAETIFGPPVMIEPDEEEKIPQGVIQEFLKWHHKLGHLAPKKMQLMADQGVLPKKFAKCQVPLCTACLFGKATRRPWRTKPSKDAHDSVTITAPGQCVSVDQLELPTPSLILQLKEIPTKARYKVATVFVDHISKLLFVHLQRSTGADETIIAKQLFERFAATYGVVIKHYHADNGRFADNKFREAVGVNAHFQNGVAVRRIRELQQTARTMLLHATRRWPDAISANLWPYALRMANDIYNSTSSISTKQVPVNMFSDSNIATKPKHWYPFGCPVYILDSQIQEGKRISKWATRARVGIYMGQSAQHARTIALVRSLSTGLGLPQFHVRMDTYFDMYFCTYFDMYFCTYFDMYFCTYFDMYFCTYFCTYFDVYFDMYFCTYFDMYFCTYFDLYFCTYLDMYFCTYFCTYFDQYFCTYFDMYFCTYFNMYFCTYFDMYQPQVQIPLLRRNAAFTLKCRFFAEMLLLRRNAALAPTSSPNAAFLQT
jgi:hypothetical protein